MSDYPMLISNKLHSFRNFLLQTYTKTLKKARLFNRKVREAQNVYFFMQRRMIVQKKAICGNIFSENFAKNWQLDSKFLYLHI